MVPGEMSKKTHLWLRAAAVAVIVAAAYAPRSATSPRASVTTVSTTRTSAADASPGSPSSTATGPISAATHGSSNAATVRFVSTEERHASANSLDRRPSTLEVVHASVVAPSAALAAPAVAETSLE